MKSYRTLALKELLSQKVTSILILIAVVLSTMMTTIVGQYRNLLFDNKNTAVSGDTAGKTKNGCIPMPEVSHQKRRVTSAFFTRVIGFEAGGILWEKCHRLF